jgi:hypothetical protein
MMILSTQLHYSFNYCDVVSGWQHIVKQKKVNVGMQHPNSMVGASEIGYNRGW